MKEYLKLALLIIFSLSILVILILIYSRGLNSFLEYGDAGDYINYGIHFWTNEVHFPLYGWLIYVLEKITFESINIIVVGLVVSVLFYLLSTIFVYKICKNYELSDRKSFFITLITMLFPAQSLAFSTRIEADSTALFFIILAFYFFQKKKEGMTILSLTIAAFAHYICLVFCGFLILFFLLEKRYIQIYRAFFMILPFILLSIYQYIRIGDIFYYISPHHEYVGGSVITFPFYSFFYYILNLNLLNMLFFVNNLIFFMVYFFGFYNLYKNKKFIEIAFSLPLFVFLLCLHPASFYFQFMRFLPFIFPVLISLLSQYPITKKVITFRNFIYFILFLMTLVHLTYFVITFPVSDIRLILS